MNNVKDCYSEKGQNNMKVKGVRRLMLVSKKKMGQRKKICEDKETM